MFKTLVMIKRRKGMSMDDFKAHYENNHAPLAAKLIPSLRRYVRHFVTPWDNPSYPAGSEEQPYDVVTEMWYDSREAFEAAIAELTRGQSGVLIAEDEERLFDRSSIRIKIEDVHETDLSGR